ncbi:hypothetical protein [Halodesulfovibrio aestuarii]|uniref:Uncharacterized protein n=1 Tax=Halodesulfovibrio aestuarii TaxID=126333 RepID=A0ABV4JQW0_9BACT
MLNTPLLKIRKELEIHVIRWKTLKKDDEEYDIINNFIQLLSEYEDAYNMTAEICPELIDSIKMVLSNPENKLDMTTKYLAKLLAKFVAIKCLYTGVTRNTPTNENTFIQFLSQTSTQSHILRTALDIMGTIAHSNSYKLDNVQTELANTTDKINHDIDQLKSNTISTLSEIEDDVQTTKENLIKKLDSEKEAATDLLDKYQSISTAALDKLASSFATFSTEKRKEVDNWLSSTKIFGWVAVIIAFLAIIAHPATGLITQLEAAKGAEETITTFFSSNVIYFFMIEALIIYFFRISLNSFYAARDELLQLEIREALCKFAPTYTAFADADDTRLDNFTKHIFSPLTSKLNPTPHPLDFLGQVCNVVNNGKKK